LVGIPFCYRGPRHLAQAQGGYADVRGTGSARPPATTSSLPLSAVTVPYPSIL
jgi:hypothetical protein